MHRIGRAKLREETVEALLTSTEHSIGVPCQAEERDLLQWLAVDLIETSKRLRDI